jgi:hypothetical protein
MASKASALVLFSSLAAQVQARPPAKRFGGVNTERPPYWLIIPFICIVIGFLIVMIWLIVADERQDARRKADEKKANSLKFGRMDPRYHKD